VKAVKCRIKNCEGDIVRKEWTQPLEGGKCPKGTYEYYECSGCGVRYTPQEVKDGGI